MSICSQAELISLGEDMSIVLTQEAATVQESKRRFGKIVATDS